MTRASAVDNEAPNRTGEALPFCDFRTLITCGWDSQRPKNEGWWDFVKYLLFKFMVTTDPVLSWLWISPSRVCSQLYNGGVTE